MNFNILVCVTIAVAAIIASAISNPWLRRYWLNKSTAVSERMSVSISITGSQQFNIRDAFKKAKRMKARRFFYDENRNTA